jgi:argininosuccinate synthase
LGLSREQEIEYLQGKGVEMNFAKAMYSINKGLVGHFSRRKRNAALQRHVAGRSLADPGNKTGSENIQLFFRTWGFEKDQQYPLLTTQPKPYTHYKALAGPYGIGAIFMLAIPSSASKAGGFEAAAPMVIIKSHHLLEKHVLTKVAAFVERPTRAILRQLAARRPDTGPGNARH